MLSTNRAFPSCLKPLFHSEAKCEAIDLSMFFNSHANRFRFQQKGFALSLVLKARVFGTHKWPVRTMVAHPKDPKNSCNRT